MYIVSYCLRCGWCCKSINPFDLDECPYLKDNLCSIYENRPNVCKIHDDPTSRFCSIGMDILGLTYQRARDRFELLDFNDWAKTENLKIKS